MDFESMHNQYAVYWAPGRLADGGKQTYQAPVELRCRWEDSQLEMKDPRRANGVWMSKSQVFTTVRLDENGYLWEGRLVDINADTTAPTKNRNAMRVEVVERTPSVDGTEFEYVAYT